MEMFDINNCILASSVPKKVCVSLFSPSGRGIQHPFSLCTRVGMLLPSDAEAELCFYIGRRYVQAIGHRHTYSNTWVSLTPVPLVLHSSERNLTQPLWIQVTNLISSDEDFDRKTCPPHSPLWCDQSYFSDRVRWLHQRTMRRKMMMVIWCSALFGLKESGFKQSSSRWWFCPTWTSHLQGVARITGVGEHQWEGCQQTGSKVCSFFLYILFLV